MKIPATLSTSLVGALALSATSTNAANVVMNGDFSVSAPSFSTFPGYAGGGNPAAIPDWGTPVSGSGVNGTLVGMHSPFGPADNSAVQTWAILQNAGTTLTQSISLAANTTYNFSYLAAGRNGNADTTGRVLLADDTTTYYDSTATLWSTAAFQEVSSQFSTGTTFDGSVVLTLSNDSAGGDNTVNYSNIVVAVVPEPGTVALFGLGGVALMLRRRK